MYLTFKKEQTEDIYMLPYGLLESCWMYTITSKHGKIGKFLKSSPVSFFAFDEEDIRIDYIHRSFRQTQYLIIDQKNDQEIGSYDIKGYSSNWTPYGKLYLGNNTYQCEKLKPDVKHKFFRKETWGHFKVRVGNSSEAVTYTFKFEYKHIFQTIIESHTPFGGEILLEGSNLLLLFAGIFLVEQVLAFEVAGSSG